MGSGHGIVQNAQDDANEALRRHLRAELVEMEGIYREMEVLLRGPPQRTLQEEHRSAGRMQNALGVFHMEEPTGPRSTSSGGGSRALSGSYNPLVEDRGVKRPSYQMQEFKAEPKPQRPRSNPQGEKSDSNDPKCSLSIMNMPL